MESETLRRRWRHRQAREVGRRTHAHKSRAKHRQRNVEQCKASPGQIRTDRSEVQGDKTKKKKEKSNTTPEKKGQLAGLQ